MLCECKAIESYKLKLLCGFELDVVAQSKEQLVVKCLEQLRRRIFIAIVCFLLYNIGLLLQGTVGSGCSTVYSAGILATALFQLFLVPTGVVTGTTGDSFMLF